MRRAATVVTIVALLSGPALAQKQLALLATVTDPGGAPPASLDPAQVNLSERESGKGAQGPSA